jgi:hypothetical protein
MQGKNKEPNEVVLTRLNMERKVSLKLTIFEVIEHYFRTGGKAILSDLLLNHQKDQTEVWIC